MCKFLLYSEQTDIQCIKKRNQPLHIQWSGSICKLYDHILSRSVRVSRESQEGVPHVFSQSTQRFSLFPAPGQAMPRPRELTAFLDGLIRVVSTIIVYVTLPGLRDAVAIGTLKIAWLAESAGTVGTVFIWVIPTVIYRVTLPGFWDATFVGTLPFIGLTLVVLYKQRHFVISLEGIKNRSFLKMETNITTESLWLK